tara:strand:+ start:322 stop:2394 length:2073 start_codon:yes stop_codon:yes gene_type:complete
MTSEIRVNKLTNRIGLSTVTFADSGIGVTVTGRIDPDTDSARDLGTTSVRWRNAYVDTYYGDGSNLTGISADKIIEGDTKVEVVDSGSQYIVGEVNGSEKIRILSDGQVKLTGNNTGNHMLGFGSNVGGLTIDDVGNQHSALEVQHGSNKFYYVSSSNNNNYVSSYGTGRLAFEHTGTHGGTRERLTIAANGNIGVNVTSPSYTLDVNGDNGGGFTATTNSTAGQLSVVGKNSAGNVSAISRIKSYPSSNGNTSQMAFETRNSSSAMGERLRIDSVGRVFFTNNTGSGTSRVGGRLELSQNNPETWITINESSDSGTGPALYINRTRGSNVASPGPVENGNYIGSIHFGSYDTNSYEKGASIQVKADGQTWADGDCPARLAFYTTPDGGTSPREWMRISNDGTISFARGGGNQDPSHNPTVLNGKHRYSFDYSTDDSSIPFRGMKVYGSYGIGGGSTDYSYAALFDGGKTHNNCQNQYITFNQITQQLTAHTHGIYCQNSSSYGVSYCYEGKMMKNLGAYTNSYTYHSNIVTTNSGGSAYHFRGADNDTTKVLILQNGDLDNANNSYSGLSDIKLKENIVDAGSQWDDIKNLKVRKFNFKAETGHETHTQIGLIAQETEPVSAGLVYEENDITVDESTGEGTVTGTTKHIKYSVLYMKAVKALQEAMTRIETLEQDNIALRARITNLEGN